MGEYEKALSAAVLAAREAGNLLRNEFHRPGGPRGSGQHAPADEEAERLIRSRLTAALPSWGYLGEETGRAAGTSDHMWAVDPNDGTKFFLLGYRGSSVSIAALRSGVPVLGVVYAFAYPDDEGDLISWVEGGGPIRRNGQEVLVDVSRTGLEKNSIVLVSQDAEERPAANTRCVVPARYRTVTSIAYRLALAAAGEAVAAISLKGPHTWDYAAGHALLRASGGSFVNEAGSDVTYTPDGASSTVRCFGGAPDAVRLLTARLWNEVLENPASSCRSVFEHARIRPGTAEPDSGRLSRAQGCLLGQFAGDALGALVEFQDAERIRISYPGGLRELVDGGTHNTLAGQPTDDSEMALMLARSIAAAGSYEVQQAIAAYVHWYESGPFDIGNTTATALRAAACSPTPAERLRRARAAANADSQANGSLMRISPLGIYGWHRPEEAAACAVADSAITHPNDVCGCACASFVRAIAAAVAGAGSLEAYSTALAEAKSWGSVPVLNALAAARRSPPDDIPGKRGWVLVALQNAFYQLLHARSFEEGVTATVIQGGDTDTNAAICGARLGAAYGRESIPLRWRQLLLSCRPIREAGAVHPRPSEFWPVDALELAECLLLAGT